MSNAIEHTEPEDPAAEEARKALNARRLREAEDCFIEYLALRARDLLDTHKDGNPNSAVARDAFGAVIAIERMKGMNEHDQRADAGPQDAAAVERKRAELIRRADAVRAELQRQADSRGDGGAGAAEDLSK
jgi:hypothetical protein